MHKCIDVNIDDVPCIMDAQFLQLCISETHIVPRCVGVL